MVLLEPENNAELAGLQLSLSLKLLSKEKENMQHAEYKVWVFHPKQHECSLPASADTAYLKQAHRHPQQEL